jgi:hypothetical protein
VTPRFLVVDGHLGTSWREKPVSPAALPPDGLVDSHVAGDFATVGEAIARCQQINESLLATDMHDKCWSMVVVEFGPK